MAVACPSASFCVAMATGGTAAIAAATYDGTSWGNVQQLSQYNAFDPLSCVSTTSCQALENTSLDYTYDGNSWRTGRPMDPHGGGIADVSCVRATTFWVALDVTGRILTTTDALGVTWRPVRG
jgi:hypothetical protein